MRIELDEATLVRRLEPLLGEPRVRRGLGRLANDPFFVAFFLVSVSQGEGLGESAVGMIGQEELARRIRELRRVEAEERAHKERTLEAAAELFPEYFDDSGYRYRQVLDGRTYYVSVLEENRAHLAQRCRRSRLNLYLTTTFGYEVMVTILYRIVAEEIARSRLPARVRERVARLLDGILAEEETHLGVVDQHNALLSVPRIELSAEAREMLDALGRLRSDDYAFAAEISVRRVVEMMRRYAEPGRRAEIESCESARALGAARPRRAGSA